MTAFNNQYAPGWIQLGKINGKLYQIFAWAAVKGLIWYDPKNFAAKGYQVPTSWDEMITLQNKIKSDGTTPWCVAVESGAASGWPGSDWVKEIVLSQAGPTVYDSWWQGKTKWTDPAIKQAVADVGHHPRPRQLERLRWQEPDPSHQLRQRRRPDVQDATQVLHAQPGVLHHRQLRQAGQGDGRD